MTKNAASVLFLTLAIATAVSLASAQTRPRRADPTAANATPSPSVKSTPPVSKAAEEVPHSAAQTPARREQQEAGEDDVVRVDTTLVTVPVSITDRSGRYIVDLRKEDFRLFEDGVEQQIAYFATVDKPFTVVLMLDTSASTWSKLSRIKEAALAFVGQLRPDDQVMVTSFARGFTVKCQPTQDRQKIRAGIQGTGRGMSTRLYDAVERLKRKELSSIGRRKAVVVFMDSGDE